MNLQRLLLLSRDHYGFLFAILGTFLFALKSILIKLAFASGGTAVQLLWLRMLLAAPFYIGMLLYLRKSRQQPDTMDGEHSAAGITSSAPARILAAFALGFLGYYLASLLDMQGLRFISAQLERLTLFTYPILIAFLAAAFLGERLTMPILLAIVLCYAGIWSMYAQEKSALQGSQVGWGVMLVLGSALSYSLYVVLAKPQINRMGSRKFTCWAMLGSTFFVTLHFLGTERLIDAVSMPQLWLYGLLLAFVCTVLPSFLINESIARIGATKTSIVGAIGPVITMLLAIIVLDEPTSAIHFIGMALVILGVGLVSR